MNVRNPGNVAERESIAGQKFPAIRQAIVEQSETLVGPLYGSVDPVNVESVGKIDPELAQPGVAMVVLKCFRGPVWGQRSCAKQEFEGQQLQIMLSGSGQFQQIRRTFAQSGCVTGYVSNDIYGFDEKPAILDKGRHQTLRMNGLICFGGVFIFLKVDQVTFIVPPDFRQHDPDPLRTA